MAHVTTGCRDCKKCTNSGYANLGRNTGRASIGIMTLGMSEAVMAGTKNCRVCGHKLSLHTGADYVRASQPAISQPVSSAAAPGWYPVPGANETRWWDGQRWGQSAAEWHAANPSAQQSPSSPGQAAAPAAASQGADVAASLARLAELHSSGALSDEQYEAAKRQTLGL